MLLLLVKINRNPLKLGGLAAVAHHDLSVDGSLVFSFDLALVHQGGIEDRNQCASHHIYHLGDPSHGVESLVDLADLLPHGGYPDNALGYGSGGLMSWLPLSVYALLRLVPSLTTSKKLPTAKNAGQPGAAPPG